MGSKRTPSLNGSVQGRGALRTQGSAVFGSRKATPTELKGRRPNVLGRRPLSIFRIHFLGPNAAERRVLKATLP